MLGVLRWLWLLVPANPLVVRTVAGGARRPAHQWGRMAYLGGLIGLVTMGLLTGGAMRGVVSLTELAKAGTWVFAIVAYGQVILICLLAPLFMAGAIASEQTGRTYDILLTTPLSNVQIVLGSLLGRLFFVLALLISGLPLFAVLLIFGGVPIRAVFVCFAASALTALLVGSVAVAISVLRAGGRKTVYVFVISIAGYLVASFLLDLFVLRAHAPRPASTTWLTPVHPLLLVEASIGSADYRVPSYDQLGQYPPLLRWYLSRPLGAFAAITCTVSAALLLVSTFVLRRLAQSEVSAFERFRRRWSSRSHRRRPRPVRGNPVAWREAHCRVSRVRGALGRSLFVVIGAAAALVALRQYHTGSISAVEFQLAITTMLMLELAVIVLVSLYVASGAVSSEREDGTLDLMLTTTVTPKQYIWGKLSGVVRSVSFLLAVPVATVAFVAIYAWIGELAQWPSAMVNSPIPGRVGTYKHPMMFIETPLLVAVTLVPFTATCVMIGLTWSLKAQRVLGAVVPSLGIVGMLMIVGGFCGWSAAAKVPLVGPVVNAFSPATGMLMLINPWERIEGFDRTQESSRMVLWIAALVAGGTYGLLVRALLYGMVRSFDHTVRRLSGE